MGETLLLLEGASPDVNLGEKVRLVLKLGGELEGEAAWKAFDFGEALPADCPSRHPWRHRRDEFRRD